MGRKKVSKKYPVIHEEACCGFSEKDKAKIAGPNDMVTCSLCLRRLNKISHDEAAIRGDI